MYSEGSFGRALATREHLAREQLGSGSGGARKFRTALKLGSVPGDDRSDAGETQEAQNKVGAGERARGEARGIGLTREREAKHEILNPET